MTDSLAIREDMPLSELGATLVKSHFFADSSDVSQAIVKVLAGRELGFGPIASMTGVYIVKGKVSLSANLIAAAIKRTNRYNYRIIEHTNDACEIAYLEDGKEVGKSRFTMEDAKRAGLADGTNWKSYPKNMLFARCMSNGAKWYCPDVFGGPVYTPDELGAPVNEEGEVITVVATNPVQNQLDNIRTIEANKPVIKPNGDMTLEEALKVTNSENVAYGDIPTEKLSMMANSIDKKLKNGGYSSDNQDLYLRKLAAIKLIIESRVAAQH